jgi:hypothetical protein
LYRKKQGMLPNNLAAIGLVLRTIGKHRGYGDQGKESIEESVEERLERKIDIVVMKGLIRDAMHEAGYQENDPYSEWWAETTISIIKQYMSQETKRLMRELKASAAGIAP